MTGCAVEGCGSAPTRIVGGLCSMHYQRHAKTGDVGGPDQVPRDGSSNGRWKGGRVRGGHQGRYWMCHVPDHPAANSLGYVLEHRLRMEEHIGRHLRADEIVHHLNHDPSDNRIENLAVMTQGEHARLHNRKAS